MRNLLALLALLLLAFAGVGYYRDWYKVQSSDNDLKITIDRDKVKNDVRRGEEKVHQALDKGKDSTEGAVKSAETSRF